MYKETKKCNCSRKWWKQRILQSFELCSNKLKYYTKANRDNERRLCENPKRIIAQPMSTMTMTITTTTATTTMRTPTRWFMGRRKESQFQSKESGQYADSLNCKCSRPHRSNNWSKNNSSNKSNKLLIIIIILLITAMTATTCQSLNDATITASAAAMKTTLTTSTTLTTTMTWSAMETATMGIEIVTKLALLAKFSKQMKSTSRAIVVSVMTASLAAAATGAATTSLSVQQQQQQRQLFAMLTKSGQRSIATSVQRHTLKIKEPTHGGDGAGIVDIGGIGSSAVSLETIGFVSDDGDQRYEKAEKALATAAAAASAKASDSSILSKKNYNTNCPKECTCLNDFFDCGKKHLDRVPILPGYVQTLDLVGNKLNDTTVLQIENLAELKRLSLKRNQLNIIPKFVGLTSLRQLNLANNHIQRISSEAISALPKLRILDLSRNYLHTLEANNFPKDNRLAHLTLNANEISNIDEGTFVYLGGLTDLELNSNSLATLPAGVFKSLNKLKKLSLNNNNLEINWSTFKGLEAIQKLSLQSNNIRSLQDGVFHVMHKIESIELDHNWITSLSRQGLYNLTKLHYLSLSNNSISRIELDTWEFTQSLVSLDLSNNNISEFKPQHLDCLQQLRQLNLGHNKIQFFPENTFDCVKNLEELNLKRNRLAWIIEDPGAAPTFKSLRKLKKLDLTGNNLKQINSKSLSGLTNLEQLNLEGNALASVQKGAFEHMVHLQKFKFKSMNFICDCEILWFRRWLQSHGLAQMQKSAICGYPDQLLDRELLTLTPAELICADSPKPVIVHEPTNQLAVKGANITMECIASSPAAASLAATDELKIKWRHDNQNLRERFGNTVTSTPAGLTKLHNHHHNHHHSFSNSYSTTETQIHHDQTTNQTTIYGYLRLYNVSYESAGRYQCVVSNAFGTTYSQKFKLSIGIHPKFLQIPSNLTIDSGDTARLVCSATGDPMPEIALQKYGASDFPAATERRLQVIREENAFLITNAKPMDTGIYTCTAESAAGDIKINASLIVNDKPQPNIPLAHKEVVIGSSSVLECLSDMATELQNPHREWFKDNKPFYTSTTSASERFYFTTEKELLVIVNTQSMDFGLYRCEITDDSKTYSLETKLIVVKEDINPNVIIIASAIVAFILVVLLVVGAVLCYQRRKIYLNGGHSLHSGSAARVIYDSSHLRTLGDSRGSALDQTQLTTLNRSYLRQQYDQTQRPRSTADLDMNGTIPPQADAEQLNCLIISTTPSYQQQLQNATLQNHHQQQRQYDGSIDSYLRRNSLYDADHQQDYLSSKDSGTGSDAAVKRSIDDFTIALLPVSGSADMHELIDKADGILQSNVDIENDDLASPGAEDSDQEIATSPVLGISEVVELREFARKDNMSIPVIKPKTSSTGNCPTSSAKTDQLYSTHSEDANNIDGGSCIRSPLVNTNCKHNLNTNFGVNTSTLPPVQAVDI